MSTVPLRPDCPSAGRLADFLAGRLPDAELAAAAAHLDACPACAARAAAADAPQDELATLLQGLRDGNGHRPDPQPTPASAAADAGRQLGEYALLWPLGQGGMGRVWRAVHRRLGKTVAVKLLAERRADDPSAVARFEREMAAVGRLDHPNIVRATDAGEAGGTPFLVMEHVEGVDAGRLVDRGGPLAVADACEIARQAALALGHAHAAGLIHRDVKPSNLMLTPAGAVKLLDLGLALVATAGGDATSTGVVMGTPNYMAPEQADDPHAVDARADLYALGCSLYHWLTGAAPFAGPRYPTPFRKLKAHATEVPVPLRDLRPDAPRGLAGVLDRLLAKSPAGRYATDDEAAAALAPFAAGADLARAYAERDGGEPARVSGRSASARPKTLAAHAGGLAAVALALAAALWWLWPRPPADGGGTIRVTTLADEPARGQLTLREALARAATGDADRVIHIDVDGELELRHPLPPLAGRVELIGPGAATLTVRRATGAAPFRLLTVESGATVRAEGLTLAAGEAREGGGILNQGSLTLTRVVVSGCISDGHGGGLVNGGTLRLVACTVADNRSGEWGGGLYNTGRLTVESSTVADNRAGSHGGGIYSAGSLSMTVSTVSGNRAARYGGGLVLDGGTALLNNSTVAFNRADAAGIGAGFGGGLRVYNGPALRLFNVLVAGNRRGAPTADAVDDASLLAGTLAGGHNLIGAAPPDCGLRDGEGGNRVGTPDRPLDARLGPLADNGGPSRTHLPAADSPVIDAADRANAPVFDQRNRPRIVNSANDIGSVERQPGEKP